MLAGLTGSEEQPADDAANKARKAALVTRLVVRELPADSVTQLKADVKAVRHAKAAQETERENRGTTAAVGPLLKNSNAFVATAGAIMQFNYTRQPYKLHAWQGASHVERLLQHERRAGLISTPLAVAGR